MDYSEFFYEEKKEKSFNTVGICYEEEHYMVDISDKLKNIMKLVLKNRYFVINRPRQYGKTTTLNVLWKILKTRYKVLKLNFEGLGSIFESEKEFSNYFVNSINEELGENFKSSDSLIEVSKVIQEITKKREVILIIDEVDKGANNILFVEFLGMLRSLYLSRATKEKTTFKSVILAGVYDIKNLKFKSSDRNERYNSPWNIAVNFNVDMSFNEKEISSMLKEYKEDKKLQFDDEKISSTIYKFTNGYPFLVSRICQIIDEDLIGKEKRGWRIDDVLKAIKLLLDERNTLFDDLIKNLENNKELFEYIYSILVLGVPKVYNGSNPIIDIGEVFGYLTKNKDGLVEVSNRILKEFIYNYMVARVNDNKMIAYNFKDKFIDGNGLNMRKVLLSFQQFMKENYSTKDVDFLERHGVLLFLAFIKPIINGIGFDYKEVQISEEKRLDIVISYNQYKYIIETKIWRGEVAHKNGLIQLQNYLEIEGLEMGYLLIFNFNKNKEYLNLEYELGSRKIFEVIV
ncbi:MAG: AAA family ATPase [Sarcina sp.]